MAFGGLSNSRGDQPMAEINMIPLIDVMLVLLVIFIVTAPLLTHAVKVDLPKASSQANIVKRESVQLSIDASGKVFWNAEPVDQAGWRSRMQALVQRDPQTELHIRADAELPYKHIAGLMSDASRLGLSRIGFVTDPSKQP